MDKNLSAVLGTSFNNQIIENVHIVGAGISGLLSAYYFKKRQVPLTVYEKTHLAGGLLGSQTTPFGLVEHAANGIMRCPELDSMVQDLGLEWLSPLPQNKNRYVLRNNQLRRMPLHLGEIAQAIFHFVAPQNTTKPIVTLRDFADTYLSSAVGTQLLEPAMQGIYAASLNELGLAAVFPDLAKLQQKGGSLAWNLLKKRFKKTKHPQPPAKYTSGTASFKGGMQAFITALSQFIAPQIHYNSDDTLAQLKNCSEPIILCVPAYEAARFFGQHPIAQLLQSITYIPVVTATFFVSLAALEHFKSGFGCLIPRNEHYITRGILFNHCIFEHRVANASYASLTCIATETDTLTWHNDTLIKTLLQEITQILGLKQPPLHVELRRYRQGLPLYSPQLPQIWKGIDQYLQRDFPNIRLFGNYSGKISIRNMCQTACQAFGD